tara:strand:+ start:121 stop:534 length:414 start_codon:yes stop_codon:yes gene_type:complete
MAKSNSFKLAELIRVFQYDTVSDEISTTKTLGDKNKSKGDSTTTATTQVNLDTFAHASFRAARYVIAMSEGSDFHSTELMLIHDGTNVTLTAYGTLKSGSALATFDADISGSDLRLRITPASSDSTVTKFDRTTVDA